MKNKGHLLLYTCAILLGIVIVAACSGGGSSASQPAAAPAATAAPTEAAASANAASTTVTNTTAVTSTTQETTTEVARPSNPGGPGPALALSGDVKAGEKVYVDNCQKCHGEKGVGEVKNPGSDDGTIPPLAPIDETMVSKDAKVFATNIDLFIEHGSKPAGTNPKEVMAAFGDEKKLTAQQIADVIAYVISLNTK
jgi:mono/diheme cytochrome c family protein